MAFSSVPRVIAATGETRDSAARTYRFREPHLAGYRVPAPPKTGLLSAAALAPWVDAYPENGSTNRVQFGARIVLQLHKAEDLGAMIGSRPLSLARTLSPLLYIVTAPDVWTALDQAESLAADPRVAAAYPVTRRARKLNGDYAPRPNDPLFYQDGRPESEWQANLEYRDTNGAPLGLDLNVRAAWPVSTGRGVLVAIADDGFETDHPDLVDRARNAPHYNFASSVTNGQPSGPLSYHATAVAGLAVATHNNHRGIAGVAPEAQAASWVIFAANDYLVSEEALLDMFQYQSNIVSVQNHSWGKVGNDVLRLSTLENFAISNAVTLGRGGRGVVIVRAAGNGREDSNDANEDGYLADPRVIAVAAARLDGRPARYSSPGACVLVAAPSGDVTGSSDACFSESANMVTTDRQGGGGYNRSVSTDGSGDYTWGETGFDGTSAATPQITGVVALILAANANLTYRDVQQILVHASRHYDFSDPTLVTNGAGFQVSYNLGYGVPDAGFAVKLAKDWINRPPATNVTYTATNVAAIPDLALRVAVEGPDVPDSLRSLTALPGGGPHPTGATARLPIVDVGGATNPITADLRGKAALIRRDGITFFCQKIAFAAAAGAELAIVCNNRGGDARILMAETDLTPIPSVFIGQTDGDALRDYVAAVPDAQAGLDFQSTNYAFAVKETLQCEFVGVRLNTDHTARGDVRVVLTSPSGTRSVLQRANQDTTAGPRDWTYYSVQHFYESSAGTWTVSVSDENTFGRGSVNSVSLILSGVPITDTDRDGLDDPWEVTCFGNLLQGPRDDPDHDGYSNAREQVMGTNPAVAEAPLQLTLSVWDKRLARLSWTGSTNALYRIDTSTDSAAPLAPFMTVPGTFPETEWYLPYSDGLRQFYKVQAAPAGK